MTIVIFILSSLVTVYMFSLTNTNNAVKFKDAQSSVLYALQSAKNRALNGSGSVNGISIVNGNQIVEYKGSDTNITVNPLPSSVSLNPQNITIKFNRLTAESGAGTITITDTKTEGKSTTITVAPNGTITAE